MIIRRGSCFCCKGTGYTDDGRMIVETPEIHWHGKNNKSEAIYSAHVQPQPSSSSSSSPASYRIVTGGVSEIRIWLLTPASRDAMEMPQLEFRASLERHEATINVVRFSPDGQMLASGDVDGLVILWRFVSELKNAKGIPESELGCVNLETWTSTKVLRKHVSEVTDLAWSPDGTMLVTSSVDDSSIVWDVEKGAMLKTMGDAEHYVLGANWDPYNRFIVTLSADKALRVYNPSTTLTAPLQKVMRYNVDELNTEAMFIGEDNCMARRRLDFSPDGKHLLAPAGATRVDPKVEGGKKIACSYLFDVSRKQKMTAKAILPATAPTSLARFCPKMFTLREYTKPEVLQATPTKSTTSEEDDVDDEAEADTESEPSEAMEVERSGSPEIPPPPRREEEEKQPVLYRLVYAVATTSTVFFYDTQLHRPFGFVESIHVADISDIAWTPDGRILVVSSLDGFCTFIEFVEGELATREMA
ncbi:hypothetical protein RvY_18868-2 [Ramazzottius varieornatus]|uniref:CAF1B/HIR1 beta-propeller domain-containing protein n=1 Tax=Ramazzottius varieornatus TaxID=947166 RepID=A0A1D1W7C3_RAMVA|nr:hypothetical protein RvY_18868-2 [Ramazzottius varieornatus]